MDYLVGSVLTGAGATALIDMWAVARKRLLGIPALDYGLVGRWLAHLARGAFATLASPLRRRCAASALALITHAIFGLGLYISAWAANLFLGG